MGRPETPERLRQIRARRQGGVFKASAADDFVDFTVDEPPKKMSHPPPKGSKKQMYQNRSYRQSTGDGTYTDDGSAIGGSRAESPTGGSHASQDSRVPSPDQHSRLTTGHSRQAMTGNLQRSGNRTSQSPNHESALSSVRSSRESQSPASRTSMHPSLASHFPPKKGNLMVNYESDEDEDEESDDDSLFSATTARASLHSRESIMPSGTKRSLILPEILDKKLKDRFMSSGRADLHKVIPLKRDPAMIMMNRLKQTRCVVRIAKLGDGVYGTAGSSRGKTFEIPPMADLGNAVDECNSDEEDEFLLTDDLVRNLTAPPLTAARMHILNTKTDDLARPMTTSYSQWPPRVASPTKRGPLHVSHNGYPASLLNPPQSFPIGSFHKPATPSSQASDDESSRPGTRETIMQSPDSFFSPSPLPQPPKTRHISQRFIGGNTDRSRQKRRAETASATAGLMGDIPVRQGTAPASVPTLKEMRESMGKHSWVGHKQWKHENQERIRTAFADVTLEESFDSTMTRRRLESRPMRQCYGKQHLLANHVSHRTMSHAAEPGPEVGDSSLARHYAQTSKQAESEVVVFRRRFDTLLAASGPTLTSINLSASLSGDRNFRLLLVTLPLYPSIRELVLRNNGLDDGYMDVLVDTLVDMASITTLDVSSNRLSWVSASKLGTMLKKRTRDLGGQKLQIENLQMNDNNIGNRGIELLGESLLDARHLRKLGLSKCGIAATGGKKLGQVLSEALAVQELNLSWNELGVQGAGAILSGVGVSPALKRLDLSHNFFGDGAAEAIAEGLSQTEALCHIDLSSNFLGIHTCIALGQALLNRSTTSKQTLQKIVLDNNPCTVNGASMIAEFLAKTTSGMKISMQGCSFEKAAPKRAFSPDDPEGQYSFSLDNPVERAEAIQLLKARNLQVPAAWHVSLLDGKAFDPLGPWDAPPPVEKTEDTAEEEKKKKESKGKDKKGEEEEKPLDPWDPMMALPMDGELYVEFRNVCMPQVAADAEDSPSVLDEASFERAWSLQQTRSTTDEWRVGYIRCICFRTWLSADQVVSILDTFIQPEDKMEAAFCMFWRLLSYKEFYKIHCFLSHKLRSELYRRIGLTDLIDLGMPMGHYRLDMRMRVQNCAAQLLQFLWRREVEEKVCIGEQRSCWRNVELDGKSVTARINSLLPSSGVIQLDFVSCRDMTESDSGGLMLNGTFAFMLKQLTNSQSTMSSLGREHFLERIKQKEEDVKHDAEREQHASFKQAPGRAQSRSAGQFEKDLSEAAEEAGTSSVDDAEAKEAESIEPVLARKQSTKQLLKRLGSMIPRTKEMSPSPFVCRALEEAKSYGQVSSPKEALKMLKAVYSHFTIDLKQLLVLLQCFNHSPDTKMELLKKLYCHLEDRKWTIASVVMFGLTAEEREKIIHSVGILNIISKEAPNFEYELSMRKPDHRYCLYMLLKLSVSGGSIDTRMVEPMRVNGNLVARRRFGMSELWDGLLGQSYWDKLNVHMQATSSRLGNMWQWLEPGKNQNETTQLKLLAAEDMNAEEEDDSVAAAELELDPEPEPDPEEEERAEAEAEELAKARTEAARLEAGKDAEPVKAPPPETEEEKEARRAKRKERELKKLRLGTVKFVYEVNPEAKLKGLCLLASRHWKDWVQQRKERRARAAARRIVEWYQTKKQERELRDMQQLLDMQEQAEQQKLQS